MDYLDFILRSEGKDGNLIEITILKLHKIMFLIFKHRLSEGSGCIVMEIRFRRLHTSGLPYERFRATKALW